LRSIQSEGLYENRLREALCLQVPFLSQAMKAYAKGLDEGKEKTVDR